MMSDNWERCGYSYLGTKGGAPFKSLGRAKVVAREGSDRVIVEVDGGYRVRDGKPMSEKQAATFITNMDSHPLRQYPRASMGAREKPLSVSRPDLFDKLGQARTVLNPAIKQRRLF